jgi:hypothetical protein
MEGGPLFNLQKRVGLIKGDPPRIKLRAVLAAVITFFPLLILAAMQGRALAHVDVPFVRDFSTYTRFLLAVPLFILAENILGPRIAVAAGHFVDSGLIREKDYVSYGEYIERGLRARDSRIAEAILAILAYILAYVGLRSTAIHSSTWYITRSTDGHNALTWAGVWLLFVSVPFFQFLVYRWIFRLFLWFQFLNRVRKLDLRLYPTHPDEAGGLGFVGETQRFFGIILCSLSAGTAGVLANEIVYDKVPLPHFYTAIAAYVIVAVLVFVSPLVLFAGLLLRTKRIGLDQYGSLATAYTGSFHRKWIEHVEPEDEPLLGTGDIQSLADLGNSYKFIEEMKPLPIQLRTLLHLVVAGLLPFTPLLLAVMPLKQLLGLILKVLM